MLSFCILSEFKKICASWKTDGWLWFRIFLTDMIIYQVRNTFLDTSLPVQIHITSCLCLHLCVPRDSIGRPSPACTRWLQCSSLHLGRRAPQVRPVWSTTGRLYSRPLATTLWESTG